MQAALGRLRPVQRACAHLFSPPPPPRAIGSPNCPITCQVEHRKGRQRCQHGREVDEGIVLEPQNPQPPQLRQSLGQRGQLVTARWNDARQAVTLQPSTAAILRRRALEGVGACHCSCRAIPAQVQLRHVRGCREHQRRKVSGQAALQVAQVERPPAARAALPQPLVQGGCAARARLWPPVHPSH